MYSIISTTARLVQLANNTMLQKKAEDLTAEDDIEDRARPDNKK
jgi:hypothetical protein